MTIHIALPSKIQMQLETAIRLYQHAVAALEDAIRCEAWEKIHTLQGRRDLQAHTIALIVNDTPISFVEEGEQP